VDDMLAPILDQVVAGLDSEGAAVILLDPRTHQLEIRAARGAFESKTGLTHPLEEMPAGCAMRAGRPCFGQVDCPFFPNAGHPYKTACVLFKTGDQLQGGISAGVRREQPLGEGELDLLSGMADIAANALRRAALYDEVRLYKDAFESAAEGVTITDLTGHILDVNPAFERLTGYRRAEALGHTLSLVKSGHSTPEFYRQMWAQILSHGFWSGEIINRRKDGQEWDSMLTISAVKDETGQAVAYIGLNRDITEMKSLQRERQALLEAEREQRQLAEALGDTAAALVSTLNFNEVLDRILDNIEHVVPHDSANIMLIDANIACVVRRRGHFEGELQEDVQIPDLPLGEMPGLRGMVENGRPLAIPDTRANRNWTDRSWTGWVRSYAAAPIRQKGQVIGFLNINSATPGFFTSAHAERLLVFADQAGIAIDNAQLFDDLQRSNADLVQAYDATIEGWSRALDLRDKETEGHTLRVTEMTLRLARAMGLSEEALVHVRRGALLHDIGKMGIPDGILLKPGPLNTEEWVIMRQHPDYACSMLTPIEYLRPALDIPCSHHEKWDGTGYPQGLKGEEIPLAARIFASVDVWDALSSDRPYRKGWEEAKVLEYIRAQSGRHFDPQVVEVFLVVMRDA